MHVGIVGLGTMGHALARALHDAAAGRARSGPPHADGPAVRLVAVSSRRPAAAAALAAELPGVTAVSTRALAAHAEVVLLTVGDGEVAAAAADEAWGAGLLVAHTSGALGLGALEAARRRGARTGSLHPLVAMTRDLVATPGFRARFAGAVAAVDGDGPSQAALSAIAEAVGMSTVPVSDEWRARWHAAATLAGNASAALVALAEQMLRPLPIAEPDARRALLGLLESVTHNLSAMPSAQPVAATIAGPVARGDAVTVQRHLQALGEANGGTGAASGAGEAGGAGEAEIAGGTIDSAEATAYRHAASLILLAVGDRLPPESRASLDALLALHPPR